MNHVRLMIRVFAFMATTALVFAQEFPIAVGTDNTFGGGGAYDGTNFLFAILGDASNRYSLTAQFVSGSGSPVGSRFSLGQHGSNPMVAFDGTKYFVAWTDSFPSFAGGDTNGIGNIYGRFVGTDGSLIGSPFTLVTGANAKWGQGRGTLVFEDTTYFLTYMKGPDHHTDYLYGQRISRSGTLIGDPIQISSAYARECAVAFDGTNYLVAWCRVEHPNVDKDIMGQFVSASGSLVGTNFLIDGGEYASDNPVTATFDGTRYLVAFHEQAADTSDRWNLFARFVSTAGSVGDRLTICDSTQSPTFASAAFDGANYLITWMEFAGPGRVRAQFFSAAGVPLDTAFTAFDTLGGKFPLGGVAGFVNGRFLLSATRIDPEFTNGDVYGLFLPGSTTGVEHVGGAVTPTGFELAQNYPNPFNPSTTIRYALPAAASVQLAVYDMLGRVVAVLVDEEQTAGWKAVMWDARPTGGGSAATLPTGVYFYTLTAGKFSETRKLVVLK